MEKINILVSNEEKRELCMNIPYGSPKRLFDKIESCDDIDDLPLTDYMCSAAVLAQMSDEDITTKHWNALKKTFFKFISEDIKSIFGAESVLDLNRCAKLLGIKGLIEISDDTDLNFTTLLAAINTCGLASKEILDSYIEECSYQNLFAILGYASLCDCLDQIDIAPCIDALNQKDRKAIIGDALGIAMLLASHKNGIASLSDITRDEVRKEVEKWFLASQLYDSSVRDFDSLKRRWGIDTPDDNKSSWDLP